MMIYSGSSTPKIHADNSYTINNEYKYPTWCFAPYILANQCLMAFMHKINFNQENRTLNITEIVSQFTHRRAAAYNTPRIEHGAYVTSRRQQQLALPQKHVRITFTYN